MNWASWSDFMDMGGYALYVWGSFGVTAIVIAGELLSLHSRRRALRANRHDATRLDFGAPHEA